MELEKKESNAAEKFIIGLAVFVGVVLIIVLIVVKMNVPEFKLYMFVWGIILTILVFSIIIIASHYFSKKNREKRKEATEEYEKLPKPVTLEQCRDMAKKATINPEYADYINGCLGEKVESFGRGQKSWIYTYHARGYYKNDDIFILINMHYPNDRRAILINPSLLDIDKTKMLLAVNPEPSPDIREIKTVNPILGTEQTVVETTAKQDDKEKKKEEEKSI